MARDLSIQGGIGRWGELSARALAIVSGYLVYLSRERIAGKRLRAQRSGRAVCRGRRLARCHASGSRPLRLCALQCRHYCLWQDRATCG